MTNSKKILFLVTSVTLLFFSCKKNTDDQMDSEQYYKAQLEKLIHLKEIPSSSSDAKSASSFKTYKEAYEAFSFVRTGEVFSVTTAASPTKPPKDNGTNQARIGNVVPDYYSITPNLTTSVGPTSSLGVNFTLDFRCQWEEGPNPDEWIPSIVVLGKSQPIYYYSGVGKMTSYGSVWSGLTFKGRVQGETVVAGTTTSWFINVDVGVTIIPATQPGGTAYTQSTFQAKSI